MTLTSYPCYGHVLGRLASVAAVSLAVSGLPATAANLAFVSNANVTLSAKLSSKTLSRHFYLSVNGGNNGSVKVSAPSSSLSLADAESQGNCFPFPARSGYVELRTFGKADASYYASESRTHTNQGSPGGGPTYVQVRIVPFDHGEKNGKPVRVTLNAWYYGGRYNFTRGAYTYVHASVIRPNRTNREVLIDGTDYRGTSTRQTMSFNTTVGSTFRIAMILHTLRPKNSAASGELNLHMRVDNR